MPGKPMHQEPEVGFGIPFAGSLRRDRRVANMNPMFRYVQIATVGYALVGRTCIGYHPFIVGTDKVGDCI